MRTTRVGLEALVAPDRLVVVGRHEQAAGGVEDVVDDDEPAVVARRPQHEPAGAHGRGRTERQGACGRRRSGTDPTVSSAPARRRRGCRARRSSRTAASRPACALGAGGVGCGTVVLRGERGAQLVVVEQAGEDLPALRGGELRGTRRRRPRRAGRPATRRAPGRGRRDRRPGRRRCAAPRRGSRGPAPGIGSRDRHPPAARPPPVAIGHALHPTIPTGRRRTPRGTYELCQHASGGVPRVPSDADLDLDLPAEHAAQSCRRRSRRPRSSTAGAFPAKATIGEPVTVLADVFTDGHDRAAAALRVRCGPQGLAGGPDGAARQRPLHGDVRARPARPLAVPGRRLARPPRHVAPRHGAQARRRRRRHRRPADRHRAPRRGARPARAAPTPRRSPSCASGSRPATPARSATCRPTTCRTPTATSRISTTSSRSTDGVDLEALFWRTGVRAPTAELARPVDVEVDPVRARFSAWYEFFPRSTLAPATGHGTLADAVDRLDYVASMGFDVLYLPPVHPIGVTQRKGRNNTVTPTSDDTGSPWAIGGADGGHTAVHPELGTVDDVVKLAAACPRPGHRAGARHRVPVHARPPVGHRAPDVVRPPARRHDPVRREPAEEVPGHLPARLRERRLAGPVDRRSPTSSASGSTTGVTIFRVDNPHTKAFAFWEWVIPTIRARAPRGDLPRRGVHPAAGHGAAGQDRLQPVATRTSRGASRRGSCARTSRSCRRAPSTSCARTSGRTRPTSSPSSCRPAAGRCSPSGPSSPPRCRRRGASTARRSSCSSTCRCGPGRRSTSTPRSTSCASGTSTAPTAWRPLLGRLNRIRREQPALAHLRTLRFHNTTSDAAALLLEDRPGRCRPAGARRRQPRRPRTARPGFVDVDLAALGLPYESAYDVVDQLTDARFRWHGAWNFVELDPSSPAHIFRVRPQRALQPSRATSLRGARP